MKLTDGFDGFDRWEIESDYEELWWRWFWNENKTILKKMEYEFLKYDNKYNWDFYMGIMFIDWRNMKLDEEQNELMKSIRNIKWD